MHNGFPLWFSFKDFSSMFSSVWFVCSICLNGNEKRKFWVECLVSIDFNFEKKIWLNVESRDMGRLQSNVFFLNFIISSLHCFVLSLRWRNLLNGMRRQKLCPCELALKLTTNVIESEQRILTFKNICFFLTKNLLNFSKLPSVFELKKTAQFEKEKKSKTEYLKILTEPSQRRCRQYSSAEQCHFSLK